MDIIENHRHDNSQEFKSCKLETEIYQDYNKILEKKNTFEKNKQSVRKSGNVVDEKLEIVKKNNFKENDKLMEKEDVFETKEHLDGIPEKEAKKKMNIIENQNCEDSYHEFTDYQSATELSQEDNEIIENENIFKKKEQLEVTLEKIAAKKMVIDQSENHDYESRELKDSLSESEISQDHEIIQEENISQKNESLDGMLEKKADKKMDIAENQKNGDDSNCQSEIENYQEIIGNQNIFDKDKQMDIIPENTAVEKIKVYDNQNHDNESREENGSQSENIISGDEMIENGYFAFQKKKQLIGIIENQAPVSKNSVHEKKDYESREENGFQSETEIFHADHKMIENGYFAFQKKEELIGIIENQAPVSKNSVHEKKDNEYRKKQGVQSGTEISHVDHKMIENEYFTFQKKKELVGFLENPAPVSKNSVHEKKDKLPIDEKDFSVILSTLKTEESEPKLETNNEAEMTIIKAGKKGTRKEELSNEKLIKKENDTQVVEDSLLDVKEMAEKCVKREILIEEKENNENEVEIVKETFGITIPLVGKVAFHNNEKPLAKRYDLAIERNKRRAAYSKEIDEEIFRIIKEEEEMSESDKKKKAMKDRLETINTARYITRLCGKILRELNQGLRDENKILRYLKRFFYTSLTPKTVLYVPHFIHTICFIRGNKKYSRVLRLAANECYNVCHAMFPIPPGYNFETVYTSDMRKFLPDNFEKFENQPLDYGDVDDIFDNIDDDDDDEDSMDSAYCSGNSLF